MRWDIPVLKGRTNYEIWRFRVQMLLKLQQLWDVVTGPPPEEEDGGVRGDEGASWRKKDIFTQVFLSQTIDGDTCTLISDCKTAKETWERLELLYSDRGKWSRGYLTKKFVNVTFKDGGSCEEFFLEVKRVASYFTEIKEALQEKIVVAKIVAGLPQKFGGFTYEWSWVPEKDQTMNKLHGKLIGEDLKEKQRSGDFKRGEGRKAEVEKVSIDLDIE